LESLKSDLAIASEIQQAILPRVFPPFPDIADQLDIAALMSPAKDVGGDFYDFFRIDDQRIGFVIADVSGKGIPAAIFMAVSRTLIRATGIRGGSPAECITYSNKLLAAESVDCMFVTVFYGIMDITTGEISYCNAGHNPPYVIKNNGEVSVLPMSQDPMAGAIEGLDYHVASLKLDHGDALLLFTDGVTEAMNTQFEEFGEQRLEQTLKGQKQCSCQQTVEAIKSDVAAFTDGAEQSDDITILALKRL
jgi:sigma-B regulation protein RsbU (phosphoserine phosphatase)